MRSQGPVRGCENRFWFSPRFDGVNLAFVAFLALRPRVSPTPDTFRRDRAKTKN